MKKNYDVNAVCVEVLSKISATVSHEIKNSFSIINENAGLLNDLAMMAGEDGGVPSGRVDSATAAIAKQVTRSNTIMLNLNRFSNSGDTQVSQANLQEILQLMVALTSRKAASKSVTVSIHCPDDITITTYLLPLEALLFFVLNNLYDITSGGTTLCIEATVTGAEVQINFTDNEQSSGRFEGYKPGEKEQFLAQVLGGACKKIQNAVQVAFATEN
jgi:C4-dicarboxylate-specific signal transduction histidine kinase